MATKGGDQRALAFSLFAPLSPLKNFWCVVGKCRLEWSLENRVGSRAGVIDRQIDRASAVKGKGSFQVQGNVPSKPGRAVVGVGKRRTASSLTTGRLTAARCQERRVGIRVLKDI